MTIKPADAERLLHHLDEPILKFEARPKTWLDSQMQRDREEQELYLNPMGELPEPKETSDLKIIATNIAALSIEDFTLLEQELSLFIPAFHVRRFVRVLLLWSLKKCLKPHSLRDSMVQSLTQSLSEPSAPNGSEAKVPALQKGS